ncbi:phage late control D family protein [Lysobacter sp. CA199]|uniref:phage late control D family protein n=1 Tax=Lysobacter sp. CA199 TaxID=3455608 RepID=UPI003F8D1E53
MGDTPTLPVQASRPSVEIDGRAQATLTSSLMAMDVAESEAGLARCELWFGNWGGPDHPGFQHFGRDLLEFGKPLKIKLDDALLFEGRIFALNARFPEGGTPQIGVCAEDRLQDLRMTRRSRAFADASLADVARSIAGDHGLQPRIELSGEPHKLLAQVNQSDLAFLRDMARREDAQIWVEGDRLHATQRSRRNGPALELAWAGALREFEVGADLAHQRTQLIGSGWSVADKRGARHEADEAAIRAELGGNASGAQTLQQSFGRRADTYAHALPLSDGEARVFAESGFRHMARRFVTGRGVAETKAALRVGTRLTVKGVGPLFEGEYSVTEVQIRFEPKLGLRTEFWCERPSIGRA